MGYLTEDRAKEIAGHIDPGGNDGHFYCHETTHGSGEEGPSDQKSICAGSVLMQLKDERPGQVVRTALRLRVITPDELSGWDEVVSGKEAFVEQHGCRPE